MDSPSIAWSKFWIKLRMTCILTLIMISVVSACRTKFVESNKCLQDYQSFMYVPGVFNGRPVSFLPPFEPTGWTPCAVGKPLSISKGNGNGAELGLFVLFALVAGCSGICTLGGIRAGAGFGCGTVTMCFGAIFIEECFFSAGSGAGMRGGMWWASSSNSASELKERH